MATEIEPVLAGTVAVLSTYWLHSTVLLVSAWLVLRIARVKSPALTEWLWKSAAVLGLVTVLAQRSGGFSGFELDLPPQWIANPGSWAIANLDVQNPPLDRNAAIHSIADDPKSTPIEPRPDMSPEEMAADDAIEHFTEPDVSAAITIVGVSAEHEPYAQTGSDLANEMPIDASVVNPEGAAVESTVAANSTSDTADAARSSTALVMTVLGAITALCVLIGAGRLLIQNLLFRRSLASAFVSSNGTARRILDELLQRAGIDRRVTLLNAPAISEPVAFGLFDWRIVLPDAIERELADDELRALLAHELAHLVRGDTIWLWIGRVLCSCFVFQPLNLLARRRWQRAAECRCDDWAVNQGASPVALARCLTRVAERRLVQRTAVTALAAGGSPSTLSQRIERLLETDRQVDPWHGIARRRVLLAAALVCAIAMICCGPRTTLLAQPVRIETADAHQSRADAALNDTDPLASSLETELHLLQQELEALERELAHANRLLDVGNRTGQIAGLAANLQRGLESLQARRDTLVRRSTRHATTAQTNPLDTPGRRD